MIKAFLIRTWRRHVVASSFCPPFYHSYCGHRRGHWFIQPVYFYLLTECQIIQKEVQPPILEEEAILPPDDRISSPRCLETSGGATLPDVTAKVYGNCVFFQVQKIVAFLEITLQLQIY